MKLYKKFSLYIVILLLIIFSAFGLLLIAHSSQAIKNTNSASLEIFTQQVWIQTGNSKVQAKNGDSVNIGESVITGSTGRAQLLYSNHSVTRINVNSEFVLSRNDTNPVQIEIDLIKGSIWSRVAKLLGKDVYQTKTATVIATVRGTSYELGIMPDGNDEVITAKHTVNVTCVNATQKGNVQTNNKFILNCKNDSLFQIQPLTQQDITDPWYLFNIQQDKLLDARFGAGTYNDEDQPLTPTLTPIISGSTPEVTPIPSLTPTTQPTIYSESPTTTPSSTPTPNSSNTPTPTTNSSQSVTPTPTIIPTPTPTLIHTPTITPMPSPTLTPTPTQIYLY